METNPLKVLLVETDQADYDLIHTLLCRKQGLDVELQWVQDFDEAERIMVDAEYDVCLIDDRIGNQGGLDLVRRTLISRPHAALVMLTSQRPGRTNTDAMQEGVVDCLVIDQISTELLKLTITYAVERKRIERVLHRISSEHTPLSAAVENLSVGVLITDPQQPDNPLVFVNPAFTAITGYTAEAVLGQNCRFMAHPDNAPEEIQAIRDAIRERRDYKGVLLSRRKNGTAYRNSLSISPVFDDQGTLTHFVGLSEDVTAFYQTQDALRHSQNRFAGIDANVPGMIYQAARYANGDLEFLYVSEGCRPLLGVAPDQFLEDPAILESMVHPDDQQSFAAAAAFSQTHRQPWRWQGTFVLRSGEQRAIQGMGNPSPQENGDVLWNGLMMDVTERVHAEREMAQLAAIVEGSNDAIFSKTLEGIITSWNRAAEMLYGYTAAEIIGQPVTILLPPDRPDEVTTLLKSVACGELVQSYETVRKAKDGSQRDVSLTISPIKDSTGKVIGASTIAQDITRRKETEAHVERQVLRIQALRNIDMAITGSIDLRVTLNILLDQVTTHLHVDSAAILLLNPHTHYLEYTAGRGFRNAAIQQSSLRLGEGFAGRAALERRLIAVPDLRLELKSFSRSQLLALEEFVSYWAVPLITKGRVEGVLEIFHRSALESNADWVSFLEALAVQAAIAIENAALFNNLQRSNTELQIAYDSTLEGWSKALDLRDEQTEGHTLRVTAATLTLGRAMNVSDSDLVQMRRGALLHDIGKMGIPDAILLKPGTLTDEEWAIMKMHPTYAYKLLSPIQFLGPALHIPYCHHEKWDGTGYPRGLKGEQIPLAARIFAVVDVWDALSSDRPYRKAWPAAKVREYISQHSGIHFDPHVVETFLQTEL